MMWPQSLVPWLDQNGAPRAGAKAYFFEAGTTNPLTVYEDADRNEPHATPVLANASGMFPAIFLPASGSYRMRVETSTGVTIWDVDGIAIPAAVAEDDGGEGETDPELLFATGDYLFAHRTSAKAGWVRANGRTIGSASSGATERANADCEDLFTLLYDEDTTLTVSGGRGANAAADWAANKSIALPDMRNRVMAGLAAMGNTTSTLITTANVDGEETANTLGATAGAQTVELTVNQMPLHNHSASTSVVIAQNGSHQHTSPIADDDGSPGSNGAAWTSRERGGSINTDAAGNHGHNATATTSIGNRGGGQAHLNLQPMAFATCFIKL